MAKLRDEKNLRVEWWPIAKVKPYGKNPRKRSQKVVQKIAASLREYGFRQPIVVDTKGVIIVGHGRLEAAEFLKLDQVPVHIASDLTPAQAKVYRLMDNRSHEDTDWDLDLLSGEIADLKDLGIDLSLTGFEAAEWEKFLLPGDEEDAKANEVPEIPDTPVSRLGDLWVCGNHRVLCGDCTNDRDVARLLADAKPDLMVTDPPYGVDYDPKWRLETGLNKPWQTRAEGTVQNDDNADWKGTWILFPGNIAYVWHGGAHAATVALSLAGVKFDIRSQIIWAKPSLVIGRGAYHWQHEPCWYAVRRGSSAHWRGDRKQSTLWQIPNMHSTQGNVDDGKTNHGTQKPVECMRRPILNHTLRGETVYDPFLGSGTTMIACEQTERVCFGLEIDPKYVDVIVRRWENFTGKRATIESGETFEEVAKQRGHPNEKAPQ